MLVEGLANQAKERVENRDWKPRNCVWELTLACNLQCEHCGSRAGKVRDNELSVDECLGVVDQLHEMGCELITLSGGEPTLKKGWDRIAAAIAERGMYVNMVTNGVYPNPGGAREVARRAKEAGMCNVGLSIDGPQAIHNLIRGTGTFAQTLASIGEFRAAGLSVGILTTLNQLNVGRLDELREVLIAAGVQQWRFQLAKPMGAMDDHRDIVLRPSQMLEIIPKIAKLKAQGGLQVRVGDSIGYYGPYDKTLRGRGWRGRNECWKGCQAGMQAIGIEADGGVKGCLSLQAKWGETDPFVEGNLAKESLTQIWNRPGIFSFNRDFQPETLTGICGGCRHGAVCRGGASCVSAAVNGAAMTENPYCYHGQAVQLRRRTKPANSQSAVAAAALALCFTTACGGKTTERTDPGTGGTGSGASGSGGTASGAAGSGGTTGQCVDGTEAGCASPVYGMEPPDCEDVCCDCDYGTPPPEECCATPDYGVTPDPCEDVCCDCDYGTPPPEECCAAAEYGVEPDPCEDACCGCPEDPAPPECCVPVYGIEPPANKR